MLSQRIARTKGSSEWYRGGLVAYQREIKFELLDVTPGPVVTEQAAREMASGAAKLFQADATVSVTGAAGPASQDGAPPGTVVVGTSVDGVATAFTLHFGGSPEEVCEQATDHAIAALHEALRNPRRRRPIANCARRQRARMHRRVASISMSGCALTRSGPATPPSR